MKKKLTLLLAAIIVISACLSGCGGSGSSTSSGSDSSSSSTTSTTKNKKFKVGFSMDFTTNVWRAELLKRVQAAAEKHSDEMDLVVTNANADTNKQISDVEDLVSQGIDLLIITPYVSEPLTPIISEVYEKGIPVVVIDHTVSGDEYTSFIGASNASIGKAAGEAIGKVLNGKGNVVEICGTPGMSATIDRGDCMHEALAAYPDIKILASLDGNYDQATAMKVMEDALQSQNPADINLIYTYNDEMALGALQVLKDSGNDNLGIKILSIDAQKKTLEDIKEGTVYGTFTYPWPADQAIETALDILNGKQVDKNIELESTLITKDNVDQFYDPNSEY